MEMRCRSHLIQHLAERTGKPGWVLRRCHCCHDRNAVCSRSHHGFDALHGNTCDSDDGNTHRRTDPRQIRHSLHRSRIVLAGGRKHRTESYIIGPCFLHRQGLFDGSCRTSYNRFRAHDAPGFPDRKILLPKMYSIGPASQRDVEAVVDKKRHTPLPANGCYVVCLREHVSHRSRFLSELDRVGAPLHGEAGKLRVTEPLLEAKVRQNMKSSDPLVHEATAPFA